METNKIKKYSLHKNNLEDQAGKSYSDNEGVIKGNQKNKYFYLCTNTNWKVRTKLSPRKKLRKGMEQSSC